MSFDFKLFSVSDEGCAMKVGTDGVLIGAWARGDEPRLIVDAGAGSGLVSLIAAQRFAGAHIVAVEVDPAAAECCRRNAALSPWAGRIAVVAASVLGYEPPAKIDLIVSNPPFFTETLVSPDAARACARHGAELSPLTLIDYAARHLAPAGSLAMITPAPRDDDDSIVFRAEMAGLKLRRLARVSSRLGQPPIRAMWQFARCDGPIERTSLAIRDGSGAYTAAYRALVEDYYLRLPQ